MKDSRSVKEMETLHCLRWSELTAQEPDLERLLKIARAVGDGCRTWADVNERFAQFKNDVNRLTQYIVAQSPAPKPTGNAIWDVIYWKLHNAVAGDRCGE
jgi:hypothetical protein